jgi:hypothetical protein
MHEEALTVQKFTMNFTQGQVANSGLCLIIFFVFCIFLPAIIGPDGFEGGFATIDVSGFMAIISLVVIIVLY